MLGAVPSPPLGTPPRRGIPSDMAPLALAHVEHSPTCSRFAATDPFLGSRMLRSPTAPTTPMAETSMHLARVSSVPSLPVSGHRSASAGGGGTGGEDRWLDHWRYEDKLRSMALRQDEFEQRLRQLGGALGDLAEEQRGQAEHLKGLDDLRSWAPTRLHAIEDMQKSMSDDLKAMQDLERVVRDELQSNCEFTKAIEHRIVELSSMVERQELVARVTGLEEDMGCMRQHLGMLVGVVRQIRDQTAEALEERVAGALSEVHRQVAGCIATVSEHVTDLRAACTDKRHPGCIASVTECVTDLREKPDKRHPVLGSTGLGGSRDDGPHKAVRLKKEQSSVCAAVSEGGSPESRGFNSVNGGA